MANRKFEFDTDGFQYYNDNYVKHPSKSATTGTSGDHPYNGMGRIVLKKNMVSNVNTLTQAMVNTANTIYVIKYDYVLGANITVPANCVLEFDGGSISGAHTITGNKTKMYGSNIYINPSVSFAGTFVLDTVYVDWFIKERTSSYVDSSIIKAIQLAKLANTSLTFGGSVQGNISYKTGTGNFDISGLTIFGNGATVFALGQNSNSLFISTSTINVHNLVMSAYPYPTAENPTATKAIHIENVNGSAILIDGCQFDGFYKGIDINAVWNLDITNCDFFRCVYGISSNGLSVNNRVVNNTIRVNSDVANSSCIAIAEGTEGWIISSNTILGGKFGIMLYGCSNTIIADNIIDFQVDHCIRLINDNTGLFIHDNYLGLNEDGDSFVYMVYNDVQNNEGSPIWFVNNKFKGYGNGPRIGFISINGSHLKSLIFNGNAFQTTNRKNNRIQIITGQDNAWDIQALIFTDNFYDVYPVAQDSDIWPSTQIASHFTKIAEDNNLWI